MKVLDIPSSGKRGLVVAYRSPFGLCHRTLVHPANTQTPARQHMRRSFGNFARAWSRVLTQAQRDHWRAAGPNVQSAKRLAFGPLNGQLHFQSINSARACIGLPPLWEPPAPIIFDPHPVGQLLITNDQTGLRLLLKLTAHVTADIMIFAQAPCSAGRNKRRNVSYIGLLPPALNGLCDITPLYVARFGTPRPGEKLFIVTRQQKDGWESPDHETSEIVPEPPPPQAALAPAALTLQAYMHKGCTRDALRINLPPAPDAQASNEPHPPAENLPDTAVALNSALPTPHSAFVATPPIPPTHLTKQEVQTPSYPSYPSYPSHPSHEPNWTK